MGEKDKENRSLRSQKDKRCGHHSSTQILSKTNSEKCTQFKDADVSSNLLERHVSRMIGEDGKLKWSKGLETISVNHVL